MGEKKRRLAALQSSAPGVAAGPSAAALETARSLHAAGRLKEAQQAYGRILDAAPASAAAWYGMGLLARDSGAREAAAELLGKAVALAPGDGAARMQLAWALQDCGRIEAALAQWRAACALRPGDPACQESLGIVEQAAGNTAAAAAAYRRADALEPSPGRKVKLATLISPIPASLAAIDAERTHMRTALAGLEALPAGSIADPLQAALWTNFYLAYHGRNDRELQAATAAAYLRICPSLGYVAPHCRAPLQKAGTPGKIRIGLISQFFHNHSIGRTSRGFFAQLARDRFEVAAISIAPVVDDDYSRFIADHADRALTVPQQLPAARDMIAALELDILFYQDIGMEPFSYFLSFARLAPVQCVSFGHPDTTGVPAMDYFVSSALYEPAGAAGHYSERLETLPDAACLAYYYRPVLPPHPKTRTAFGLPADRPVYLCPQNLFKIHPDMDGLIAGILRADPRGIVVLVEGRVGNWTLLLRERWRGAMPDVADRVVFLPRMNGDDYLSLIACADVMLDTVHFNGMNTSLEAFAVGTPVVTLPGAFQRGRHTQAMYRKMGLEECIVHGTREYVDRALRLANDADYRAAVRDRILENNAVLFEDAAVVRGFERCFERWQDAALRGNTGTPE